MDNRRGGVTADGRPGVGDTGEPVRTGPQGTDRLHSTLGHEHRRAILRILTGSPESRMEYDSLVDRLIERTRPEADPTGEHPKRVRLAVHHIHLPKLKRARLVAQEDEPDRVELVDETVVRGLLRSMDESDEFPP